MSTYNEYVKAARRPVEVGTDPVGAVVEVELRQVAAILALAEQQRIANLVALWRVGQGGVEDEAAEALTASRGMGFGGKSLRPEIAEALGIKTGESDD